jgi:hypothetical protein
VQVAQVNLRIRVPAIRSRIHPCPSPASQPTTEKRGTSCSAGICTLDCVNDERTRRDLIVRAAATFSPMASIRLERRPAQVKSTQLASGWSTGAAKCDYNQDRKATCRVINRMTAAGVRHQKSTGARRFPQASSAGLSQTPVKSRKVSADGCSPLTRVQAAVNRMGS